SRAFMFITFEFEPNRQCRPFLDGITIEADLTPSQAELVRGATLEMFRPGGRPCVASTTIEYLWRNSESDTRYDLFLSLTPDSGKDSARSTSFKLILKHDPVTPTSVDDLPFEKGTMLH